MILRALAILQAWHIIIVSIREPLVGVKLDEAVLEKRQVSQPSGLSHRLAMASVCNQLDNVDICLAYAFLEIKSNLARRFPTEQAEFGRTSAQEIFWCYQMDSRNKPDEAWIRERDSQTFADKMGKLWMRAAAEQLDGPEITRRHRFKVDTKDEGKSRKHRKGSKRQPYISCNFKDTTELSLQHQIRVEHPLDDPKCLRDAKLGVGSLYRSRKIQQHLQQSISDTQHFTHHCWTWLLQLEPLAGPGL